MKSELPKHLRGKYVTRAAFAKMQGEKQRLVRDIYAIVMGSKEVAIPVLDKWKKKFEQDKAFRDMLWALLNQQYNKKG